MGLGAIPVMVVLIHVSSFVAMWVQFSPFASLSFLLFFPFIFS